MPSAARSNSPLSVRNERGGVGGGAPRRAPVRSVRIPRSWPSVIAARSLSERVARGYAIALASQTGVSIHQENGTLTVDELLRAKRDSLVLELLTDERGLSRTVTNPDISSPGLVLTGYTERFPTDRMQVLGETEVAFLESLDEDRRRAALTTFLDF